MYVKGTMCSGFSRVGKRKLSRDTGGYLWRYGADIAADSRDFILIELVRGDTFNQVNILYSNKMKFLFYIWLFDYVLKLL